jgi:ectoine hydroxylase-related dioxygenase (phytanoyl-CoA dioxygenase family)
VYHETSRLDPDARLISRIENIAPFHEGFAELAEVLRASAGQLLGEEAVLFKEKVNFKMPGGEGFKPHQDSQAGWERYASHFVTVAVCIDEATLENGCLQLVAGHHRRQLFANGSRSPRRRWRAWSSSLTRPGPAI